MNLNDARSMIVDLFIKNNEQLVNMGLYDGTDNVCVCRRCGWSDASSNFSVATGGNDYDVQCPVCWAPDYLIEDIEDED